MPALEGGVYSITFLLQLPSLCPPQILPPYLWDIQIWSWQPYRRAAGGKTFHKHSTISEKQNTCFWSPPASPLKKQDHRGHGLQMSYVVGWSHDSWSLCFIFWYVYIRKSSVGRYLWENLKLKSLGLSTLNAMSKRGLCHIIPLVDHTIAYDRFGMCEVWNSIIVCCRQQWYINISISKLCHRGYIIKVNWLLSKKGGRGAAGVATGPALAAVAILLLGLAWHHNSSHLPRHW